MHCFICDKVLKVEEIVWNELAGEWEPCTECLMIISEVFKDGLNEEEITWLLEEEWGEEHGELSFQNYPLGKISSVINQEDTSLVENSS